jgi:hypothetical protein
MPEQQTQDYPKQNDQFSPVTLPEQTVAPNPELRFEMSAGIGKLIEALAKASMSFKPVLKESTNPFFKSKYADLAAVIEATRESLGKNGLAVLQPVVYKREAGLVEILTLLAHSSGEWIRCTLEMPMAKQDAQGVGSAITYGRRYSYSAVLNVASEEDDDGNAAVSKPFSKPEQVQEAVDRADYLKVFEIQAIDAACKASGKTEDEVKAYLSLIGTDRIEHIQRSGFKSTLAWANAKAIAKPSVQKGPNPEQQDRLKSMKRLWATAAEFSIPEADVKTASYEKFGVDSMTKLTTPQLDEMAAWVKSVAQDSSPA